MVRINDGLVAKWNEKNPSAAVRVGDYITEINGTSGDASDLFQIVTWDISGIQSRHGDKISSLPPPSNNKDKWSYADHSLRCFATL